MLYTEFSVVRSPNLIVRTFSNIVSMIETLQELKFWYMCPIWKDAHRACLLSFVSHVYYIQVTYRQRRLAQCMHYLVKTLREFGYFRATSTKTFGIFFDFEVTWKVRQMSDRKILSDLSVRIHSWPTAARSRTRPGYREKIRLHWFFQWNVGGLRFFDFTRFKGGIFATP